ncbi:MAG: SIS domain-containing protein [Chloroflexota bacterium]|nr:SIS domain-containing protein [Chloroflexota bacterium]
MNHIASYLDQISCILRNLPHDEIARVIEILAQAREEGQRIFIMGNGGSAATASHFACDLGKGTIEPGKPRFKVIALTDNVSLLSALANDWGYERVFVEQLDSLAQPGDVAIGISASGESENVLRAMDLARERGLTTIGFTGFDGGRLKDKVDVCLLVDCQVMEQIEDAHLVLSHLICTALRQRQRA